jgi:hypothetical protein
MPVVTKVNYRNLREGDTINVDGGPRKILAKVGEIVFLSYPGQDEFDLANKPEYYTLEQIGNLIVIEQQIV